jgi:cysteine desulfurase
MDDVIYLDNNSTTPLDPAVLEVMLPYFTRAFGNPSNTAHAYGAVAAAAVEKARTQVAEVLRCRPKEIVCTSGATESNNLAILGVARKARERGDHVVTAQAEHKSVLMPCKQLEREGFRVSYLPVDRCGRVDPDDVAGALTDRTVLVSVMAANNEVGTLQPLAAIGRLCKERGVLFHTDAVQAVGKIPLDVEDLGVDLLSVSAHKAYGPKGVGALYVRGSCRRFLTPLVHGGGQEGGLRSGTLPVANIVGLGAACELVRENLDSEPGRLRSLRERLRENLEAAVPNLVVHGDPAENLPGLLNVGFPGIDGDALVFALKRVAVSQGASCSAESFEPSHVLRAIGVSDALARASFRFGVGRFTTEDEIDRAAEFVVEALGRLRQAG